MDEYIDVLDASGELTGEVAWKSEAHRLGLWHRCFHCWVVDPGGACLLVQRRAPEKDTWPGYLDVTAAGHLRAGEGIMDGLRELEEELGIEAGPERLIPLGTRRIEQEIPGGRDREFHEVFLLLDSTLPQDLRLQEDEVEAALRIPLEDAERLGAGETVLAEEWKHGRSSSIRVSLADFVPNDDGYLGRVVRAAREALGGQRPATIF
ncbi:MAG: NUDIX hydrolase [Rubrobacteraceae bacterium]